MSHLDPSSLSQYNSLVDPHLQSYFSNERIRSHLKHAGLISGQGEIVPDGEYRTRLVRREHRKHVRHMIAENIVNRAIDMERVRQAEMKHQFDLVAKAALVNNIKESRRRSGNFSGSPDMGLLSIDAFSSQIRPKSANYHNEMSNEQIHIPRVESAHIDNNGRKKYSSKSRRHRRRSLLRSKNRSSSAQNPRSSSSDSCQIRMIYYGPKMKVDYDHLVFEPIDEIMVMQQHCGGENIIVYKENLKTGAEFTFESRRHSDYPFGLTFYVKGFIDSRISTCCEYKHRHGVRLGGNRGHFAIISVKGSKPCIKCRFEKQARLKRYAQSSKDKKTENKNPLIISLPVSDQPKIKQSPVQIPIRHTSISNDNYSEDFDDSDRRKHSNRDGYSSDSTTKRKSISKDLTSKVSKRNSTSNESLTKEKSPKKTWQIIFHTSNIPKEKNLLLKFSFLRNNEKNQTEFYEIYFKQFKKYFKTDKQYSFTVKLKDIGQPEQIRLKIQTTENDDDDDEEDDIKWHLDHIELIDLETQSHLIFPCKQWIRPLEEKALQLSQETHRTERKRKTSSSSNSSHQISPKIEQKSRRSSRSSTSSILSKPLQLKFNSARPISPETQLNRSLKSTPRLNDHIDREENKIRYRVTIYPADHDDGDFYPVRNSRIFLRLNNQIKETNLTENSCPVFMSGNKQTFELDLIQNNNEQPKKLTIGYINSDITARKWKLEKIVLVNVETGEETTFPCKEILERDESNFRAEKTFENQSNDSDNESTPRNQKINSPTSDRKASQKQQQQINRFDKQNTTDEEEEETPKKQQTNGTFKEKFSSIQNKNDEEEEEQLETPKTQPIKQESSSNRSLNNNEEQTPKQQQTNEENGRKSPSIQSTNENGKQQTNAKDKQRSPSIRSINDDEQENLKKQQTNGKTKQKSPSFQSMNEDEAHYKTIFKQLDPENKLQLGSPPPTPIPRPKTRHGRQDQNAEQYTDQPVTPLIGLDELANQTARSNDQLNLSSLPSTTTNNTTRRLRSTNRTDDNNENN